MTNPCIVHACPFIPIDNQDEKSAYATLLLHTPWPPNGEDALYQENKTAVATLQRLLEENQIPSYVIPMLEKQQLFNTHITTNGIPVQTAIQEENESNDLDNYVTMHNEEPDNSMMYQNIVTATEGVFENITEVRNTYYRNFISNSQQAKIAKDATDNQVQYTEYENTQNVHTHSIVHHKVHNYEERLLKLATDIETLTPGQRDAYDKAIEHISGRNPTQLIMFISGEGGTGKSFIIALIMEFTRLKFGKQKGLYGATVAMAPTGCSANVIKGYTWQSCYGKGRKQEHGEESRMSQETAKKIGENFRGTQLAIIDEISMINLESLAEISQRHQQGLLAITENEGERELIRQKPFGGMHMLFTGDLWQLKAIGGHPIYTTKILDGQALKGQKIWRSINEYSELTENYRFKNDTSDTLECFLRGARQGIVEKSLLLQINKRLVISRKEAIRLSHPSAVWIAHTKKSVASINEADFNEKVNTGAAHFRIIATHTSASDLLPSPGEKERELLFQTFKLRGPPTHIDLAIGTRVSCVRNLGTQIGNLINNKT